MKLHIPAVSFLDFDIENRPLNYLGSDFTFSEITAIAASFGLDQPVECWLIHAPQDEADWRQQARDMLESFRALYDAADIVTGHYIRKHDLRLINGALVELGRPPLSAKLTLDTQLDLAKLGGVSKSQENLAAMLGIEAPKIGMSQAAWREANRLTPTGLAKTRRRVTSDVRQHQALRLRLTELGMLGPARLWTPISEGILAA